MEYNNSPMKRKYDDDDDTNNNDDISIPITIDSLYHFRLFQYIRCLSFIDNDEQTTVKKQKTKKNVRFDDVTVYYFARSQGFISVPSQGTVTLGIKT